MVAYGEFVLLAVMLNIIEQVNAFDFSTLHYIKAKEFLREQCKEMETAKTIYVLMNCSAEKKLFKTNLKANFIN